MFDHDHQYDVHCHDCDSISRTSLPLLVCPRCLSPAVVATPHRCTCAKDLAERTCCQVASDLPPLDTSEAFRPESPHWGSHPSPTAKIVERDEVTP